VHLRRCCTECGGASIPTAEDVAAVNLLGTDLVLISVCRSGVGGIFPGEGVFGLRRAFFTAGARAVVMSLWHVPDVQNKELMVLFYQMLREGVSKPDALRRAKLAIRRRDPHPFTWRDFICEGDLKPVLANAFSKTN
jgi:CHAT domain-containing protein